METLHGILLAYNVTLAVQFGNSVMKKNSEVYNTYLPIKAVAFAKASLRFSLCFLLTLSASARPNWSLFLGSGILKVGPGVAVIGVSPPSKRKGVPSILPQVIRGDASTP